MISIRILCASAEVQLAVERLKQSFSEVIASNPLPCDGDPEHVLVWLHCRF